MLDLITTKKIESFVYSKPRSIQEIAKHLDKSWRTADRYIQEIEKDLGTLSTRVFREGTRGALKIVYWSSIEKISHSVFQERIEQEIMLAKIKEDFSAFDIFQYIDDKNKKAIIEYVKNEEETNLEDFADFLNKTEKQLLFFSGNLSFVNLKNKSVNILNILEQLIKKGVSIKIICRVDLAGKENIEKILSLNFKYGKQAVEIRHRDHPIRGLVSDNKRIRLKEIKEPTSKINELNKKVFMFYMIKDNEWADWLSKIFWKMFSNSVDSEKRMLEINKLKIRK
jgi:hypothetical protein